jgi:hypothetical protein
MVTNKREGIVRTVLKIMLASGATEALSVVAGRGDKCCPGVCGGLVGTGSDKETARKTLKRI